MLTWQSALASWGTVVALITTLSCNRSTKELLRILWQYGKLEASSRKEERLLFSMVSVTPTKPTSEEATLNGKDHDLAWYLGMRLFPTRCILSANPSTSNDPGSSISSMLLAILKLMRVGATRANTSGSMLSRCSFRLISKWERPVNPSRSPAPMYLMC